MHPLSRKWVLWLGITIVALCSVFFIQQVSRLLSDRPLDLTAALPLFPAAIVAYMLAYVSFASGWHLLLAATGQRSAYATNLGIFTTSQFAKYLPGNVAHHAGRVVLAVRHGHQSYVVVATMMVELALLLIIAMLLSFSSLSYWLRRLEVDAAIIAALLIGLAVAALIAGLIVWKYRAHTKLRRLTDAFAMILHNKAASTTRLVCAFFAIAAGILLSCVALGLLDRSGTLQSINIFPAMLAVFAASWLLGFLVPGAPAGIGVREVVLTEGLAPLVGRDQAILVALLFRILSTLCDLLAFASGSTLLWLARRNSKRLGDPL